MSEVLSLPNYTVIRDRQGRWIMAVGEDTSLLPTAGVPNGALFWDVNSSKFYVFGTSAGSWTQAPNSALALVNLVLTGNLTAVAATFSGELAALVNGVSVTGKIIRHHRQRIITADWNAGKSILAAVAGQKYRMVACSLIAYGGAAGALTTADILATQGTSSVKLLAGAQAQLTQSSVVKDGGTGGAVLADGASYVANDAATAITAGKTGNDLTTATGIDVLLSYIVEA